MAEEPKTLQQALDELGEAWRELVLEVCYALHVDKIVEWLTRQLRRFHR